MKGQPAIPDDVGRSLPLHPQNSWAGLRALCSYLRGDVLHGWSTLGIDPPMRRHPLIPLGPHLAVDGGVVHPATPKDEAIGLQGVQNGRWGHAGNCAVRLGPATVVSRTGTPPPLNRGVAI
jgi:hypothetical protein